MTEPTSPEKPRKLLRWTDSSELEEVTRERTRSSAEDAAEGTGSEPKTLSKREDWYGAKMQRLRDSVEQLRQDLRNKERDYIRLKNKYNVSKRKQVQLQEDLQKFADGKLDKDAEVEYLRLQLLEKDKEISKHLDNGGHLENGGYFKTRKNGIVEDCGIDDVEEDFFTMDDSILSRKYLNLHKETRKLLTYILLSVALFSCLIALVARSPLLSTLGVGFGTVGLSCLWLERKQLFRAFKLRYLKKIREVSVENTRLGKETSKLESRLTELLQELANGKQEREDFNSEIKSLGDKLGEEKSKNEELVKLEKSTFEELQSERVRRRRAEEQLEEVSVQVLLAREKDELAQCGDVCQELRNNLKLERESKEKLNRENERLIKEIVEMNMSQEKQRLELEEENQEEDVETESREHVESKENEGNLKYVEEKKQDKPLAIRGIHEIKNMKRNSVVVLQEFDAKECEKLEKSTEPDTKKIFNLNNPETIEASSQTNFEESQDPTQCVPNPSCWLCAWNIPNETSLVLLIIIVACLALALKVVLSSNVFMFVILMTIVGCFTYYQLARNIEL